MWSQLKRKLGVGKGQKFTGSVRARYRVLDQGEPGGRLGDGQFGTVHRCQDHRTGEWYALKSIAKGSTSSSASSSSSTGGKAEEEDTQRRLEREVGLLLAVDHPNLANVVDVFEDARYLQIVCELCTGGELFDAIVAKATSPASSGCFGERECASVVRKLLAALAHCHSDLGIVHRDLKPENILFKGPGKGEGEPVIVDFGLSTRLPWHRPPGERRRREGKGACPPDPETMEEDSEEEEVWAEVPDSEYMTSFVGTPFYIAPEVLQRRYTSACDLWSLGVITYCMLSGGPPFRSFTETLRGDLTFPSPRWAGVSAQAKGFIRSLLRRDPGGRPSAEAALMDPWFAAAGAEALSLAATLGPRLVNYSVGMGPLKKRALHVVAEQLSEAEVAPVVSLFRSLDEDGDGLLSVAELFSETETETGTADGPRARLGEVPHAKALGADRIVKGLQQEEEAVRCVDLNEFIAASLGRGTFLSGAHLRAAFAYFDQGGKGSITTADLAVVLGSEDRAKEAMAGVRHKSPHGKCCIRFHEFRAMMVEDNMRKSLHYTN